MNTDGSIINKLDNIDFHDLPVSYISFNLDHPLVLTIEFNLYFEEKSEYEKLMLTFSGIQKTNAGDFQFIDFSDWEIYSFDYASREMYESNLIIITSSNGPSIQIDIISERIELVRDQRQ